jgi:hypothetical protein
MKGYLETVIPVSEFKPITGSLKLDKSIRTIAAMLFGKFVCL